MLRIGVIIGLLLRNTLNTLLVLIPAPHPYGESYQRFNATSNVTGVTPQYTRTPLFGCPGRIRVESLDQRHRNDADWIPGLLLRLARRMRILVKHIRIVVCWLN